MTFPCNIGTVSPLGEKKEGNPTTGCRGRELQDVRVLVDKLGAVVDLVVDHDEEVLLGVVLGNILVRVLLRHGGRIGLNASKLFKERVKSKREREKKKSGEEPQKELGLAKSVKK